MEKKNYLLFVCVCGVLFSAVIMGAVKNNESN